MKPNASEISFSDGLLLAIGGMGIFMTFLTFIMIVLMFVS